MDIPLKTEGYPGANNIRHINTAAG